MFLQFLNCDSFCSNIENCAWKIPGDISRMLELTLVAVLLSLLCHESLQALRDHCASGKVLKLLRKPETMIVLLIIPTQPFQKWQGKMPLSLFRFNPSLIALRLG